ncbi:hypothetical protein OEZ85_012111 [Tetradesmus obliquus]|uniref:Uncharacterized protein n=1 Tax=Tetradesmus obliquus TaxID=3088 RepID=A0ABY8TWB6_TETOB|nr:hypothetical protein OEZ85_012111 [Tetradesmus obliquus]
MVDYGALSSLSRLSALGLPLAAERQGLDSISSCSQLQRLSLEFWDAAGAVQQVTLQPTARTAAMSSLAALQHLKEIALSVNENAEVAAVSALQQVELLLLVVPMRSSCSVHGLAVLAAMRQLQELTLELPGFSKDSLQEADMQLLLSAVRHVQRFTVKVQEKHVEAVQEVVQSAERALTEQGLRLPSKIVVNPITQD